MELLAPVGNMEKLKTAIYYGADAVYFAGKQFGLRAFAGNFSNAEIKKAVNFCHKNNVKAYVTVNIIAKDSDFAPLKPYLKALENANVDAVIVADMGVARFVLKNSSLQVHISTQANIINSESAKMCAEMGVSRIVLARELSLAEIKNIRKNLDKNVELECFVHGAMCISYSGRCLLSNYLAGRDSNRGACVQACRWEYSITEKSRQGEQFPIEEDERGTYILNSKDLNMFIHLKELSDAGVSSFKIEGRMKSPYYVATVVNAYRRAIDELKKSPKSYKPDTELFNELFKTSHRNYTTGFYFGAKDKECLTSSMPVQTHEFMAVVLAKTSKNRTLVEMRNKFAVGDSLEVLSPSDAFNKTLKVVKIETQNGESIDVAKNVQEKLYVTFDEKTNLNALDILRKKI